MRVIETKMNQAITKCVDWKNSNTEVVYSAARNASYVNLYGHHIATVGDSWIELYSCGYRTKTVKSRLNAILAEHGNGDRIFQKDFEWVCEHKGRRDSFH
jgi:hypothetical protein